MPDTAHIVRGPDGDLYTVPASEMSRLPAGATIPAPDEIAADKHARDLEAKHGGAKGTIAAALAGGARRVSPRLTDAAATAFGPPGTAQTLRELEEAHPVVSGAAELAGAVAPLALSGGAAAPEEAASLAARAGRAATSLPRAVATAGRVAEGAAARLVGEGAASVAGRAAQRGAAMAAGGAVEGAAYGAGHEISEAALSDDHENLAEKLIAGAGRGAVFGAVLGGAIGAGGSLARSGSASLAEHVADRTSGKSLGHVIDDLSGAQAFRAAGGRANMGAAAAEEGSHAELGRLWRDEAPALVGKSSVREMTPELYLRAAEKGVEKDGAAIARTLARVDARATELPRAVDVFADVERVAQSVRSHAGAELGPLKKFGADVGRLTGIQVTPGEFLPLAAEKRVSLTRLRGLVEDAGDVAGPEMRKVRDALDARLTGAVAENGGAVLGAEYQAATKRMNAWQTLSKAANAGRGEAAEDLLSRAIGHGAHVAGEAIGAVVGGWPGAFIGRSVGKVAGKLIAAKGNAVAADALHAVSRLAGIERAGKMVDEQITSGVKAFLLGPAAQVPARVLADKRASRKAAAADAIRLRTLQEDPRRLTAEVERAVGHLGNVAPSVASMAALKVTQALTYAAKRAPAGRLNASSLTPQFERTRYSDTEITHFARTLEGATHPLSLLSDLHSGEIPREKVAAVRELYPKLYAQIRSTTLDEARKLGAKLPYQKRAVLSVLFEGAVDDSFMPDFVAQMQQVKQTPPQEPPSAAGQPKPKKSRAMKLDAGAFQTEAQEIEGKIK